MVSTLRLLALILTFAVTFVVGPGRALAGHQRTWHRHRRHLPHRHRARRTGPALQAGTRIARFARRLVGVPYSWGGDSPKTGFDCSGLVRYVYSHFGVRLPHSSYTDATLGVSVPRRALRPGDLVFFDGDGHVGIYIGANRFVAAPHAGESVQITSLSAAWYSQMYDGARRLVGRAGGLLGEI